MEGEGVEDTVVPLKRPVEGLSFGERLVVGEEDGRLLALVHTVAVSEGLVRGVAEEHSVTLGEADGRREVEVHPLGVNEGVPVELKEGVVVCEGL